MYLIINSAVLNTRVHTNHTPNIFLCFNFPVFLPLYFSSPSRRRTIIHLSPPGPNYKALSRQRCSVLPDCTIVLTVRLTMFMTVCMWIHALKGKLFHHLCCCGLIWNTWRYFECQWGPNQCWTILTFTKAFFKIYYFVFHSKINILIAIGNHNLKFCIRINFPDLTCWDNSNFQVVTYSFFQSLTSVCPTSCHIFKTLNTISTASVFCGHTIHTFHVVFTQYAVSEHISTILTFS